MDKALVDEIIASQPDGRMLFDYFPDRYAVWVLSRLIGDEKRIAEIRKIPLAVRLLERPLIKELLALSGDGVLRREMLDMAWAEPARQFLLDFTTWSDDGDRIWNQMSRKGSNLVVQLNFSNAHEEQYQRLVKPSSDYLFKFSCHPVKMRGGQDRFRETLAWARIDLDFEADEALIEEIQSDWVREAQDMLDQLEKESWGADDLEMYGAYGSIDNVRRYLTEVLEPYRQLWEEAMMSAAIKVIVEELGIRTIFYHSYETGAAIKMCNPPRRLYTKLPRKFGFEKTETWPSFLKPKVYRKALRKVDEPHWFRLVL
ncbi:MAG: hypothetical protein AAF512_15310 [Pseudomonadota bacterium]